MERSKTRTQNGAVAKLLGDARKSRGFTQMQVADRLRRPQSFIAKYEAGERRLSILDFVAVCRALDLDPEATLAAIVRDLDL